MSRSTDILLTAIAPLVWGGTYLVTTELLPYGYPLTVGLLRALPAGLLLLLMVRQLPRGIWWWRVFLLGALNFSIFFWLLFVAAYHLPGGVAAIMTNIQPLLVIFLAYLLLGTPLLILSITAAITGLAGVALLILTPDATLSPLGIAAGLGGALCMAFGTVLNRKWQAPVSLLTYTAWQLTAGGLLLIPVALFLEPPLPALTYTHLLGFGYLSLVGGALAYFLWFRGIVRLGPTTIAPLGFLSPFSAVTLGWAVLGQSLSLLQIIGMLVVLGSIWLGQRVQLRT